MLRYIRLWLAMARFSLLRELAFRVNFLAKLAVEILWLGILLLFYSTVFEKTDSVADWSREEFLFFLGCYFTMNGLIEALFLENCNQFADLVRTGDLDFFLIKPIDEQFLVSCRTLDWSCAPNVLMGVGVMVLALVQGGWDISPAQVSLFVLMFVSGAALAYGFLIMLTSMSVWFMRNQSLFEMWWLFTTLMRYPREIFRGRWAAPVGFFFSFVVPVTLVSNVPARVMVKVIDPLFQLYTLLAALVVVYAGRRVFRLALSRYRSASS